MIEIDVTVDIEPIEINVAVDLVPPSGGGVTVHNELTGRDEVEAHPGSSISLDDVEWSTVQAMAEALDDNEAIAVDGETIIGAGTTADPYRVDQRIDFFPTAQTDDFTISADMLYKVVTIDSVVDVNVTVDNMVVADWLEGLIVGDGVPVIVLGANKVLINPDFDFTGVKNFIIRRLADSGTDEQYEII
jgi:hypothetical protein